MKIEIPEISKQIYPEDTKDILTNKYSEIAPQWAAHQLDWLNAIYRHFNDHDKYLIITYLTQKTLNFYSRNLTKISYIDFYSQNTFEIEKFNIIEIANNLNIPKESVRRKVLALEKTGVIKKNKRKIIIDRSAYLVTKPINSIIRTSRFLFLLSNILFKNKILSKPLSSNLLEKIIKENFTHVWSSYYELQIPMMLSYKKIFGDLESFCIWGACVVNDLVKHQKNNYEVEMSEFIENLTNKNIRGLNAMSISDISGIPRATVVRKLKSMLKKKMLKINYKKQYTSHSTFTKKLVPIQSLILDKLAEFSTKIFNLALLNYNKEFENSPNTKLFKNSKYFF